MWTFTLHRTFAAEDYYSNEICLLEKQQRNWAQIKKLYAEALFQKFMLSEKKVSSVMQSFSSDAEAFIMLHSRYFD